MHMECHDAEVKTRFTIPYVLHMVMVISLSSFAEVNPCLQSFKDMPSDTLINYTKEARVVWNAVGSEASNEFLFW